MTAMALAAACGVIVGWELSTPSTATTELYAPVAMATSTMKVNAYANIPRVLWTPRQDAVGLTMDGRIKEMAHYSKPTLVNQAQPAVCIHVLVCYLSFLSVYFFPALMAI